MPTVVILLVDNDPDTLFIVSRFLRKKGCHVITACNRIEAENIVCTQDIDLVILDVRLLNDEDSRDRSGIALAKYIATVCPKITIMLSISESYEDVRESMRQMRANIMPAFDYVRRPVDGRSLVKLCQEVWKRQLEIKF